MQKILKKWLKKIKLNEPVISTALGGLVILVVGILIFNYFKAGQAGEIAVEEPEEAGRVEFAQEKELPREYEVQQGESLWKISEKIYGSGFNWVDIAKENNILNPDYVEAGTKIILPDVEPSRLLAETGPEQTQEQPDAGKPAPDTYTVQKGDHLWKIAQNVYGDGCRWTDIAKENNILNPDLIETGQELKLPQ